MVRPDHNLFYIEINLQQVFFLKKIVDCSVVCNVYVSLVLLLYLEAKLLVFLMINV